MEGMPNKARNYELSTMIQELIKIFPADLQSVRGTPSSFFEPSFAGAKNLLTFAARKRGSGLF